MDSGITDSGYNQLWIQDFPLGGGALIQALFGKNVCETKELGPVGRGHILVVSPPPPPRICQ